MDFCLESSATPFSTYNVVVFLLLKLWIFMMINVFNHLSRRYLYKSMFQLFQVWDPNSACQGKWKWVADVKVHICKACFILVS